ncbi:MAG: hypothetical protein KF740_02295 [Ramlibacter sp.]|nr:hypothetical protein [Ramlibacter sp.]
MKFGSIIRTFIAFLYLGLYHWMYLIYVNPAFEYAHYNYIDRLPIWYVFAYLVALIPLLAYSDDLAPANYGATLLYVLCYAPAQLTMLFMWTGSGVELASVMLLLAGSMLVIFFFSRHTRIENSHNISVSTSPLQIPYEDIVLNPTARLLMLGSTLVGAFIVIFLNWGHMRLVGFEDVYDLRFDAQDRALGGIFGYITLWLSICFIPYYAALGVIGKRKLPLFFSIALSIVVYMTNGAKSTLMLPFVVLVCGWLFVKGKDFMLRLTLAICAALTFFAIFEPPGSEIFKSILLVRTLATGGWNLTTYHDFFSANSYTYYTHVGIVNFLTGAYPYGSLSLGQMIGLTYSGTEMANFNANFWATDGLAAMGLVGIVPATLAVAAVMHTINAVSRPFPSRLIALWLTGFWMALLNAPLSTSLLSGGGLIVIFLLAFSRPLSRCHGSTSTQYMTADDAKIART